MIFPLNHPFIDDSPLFSICSHDIAIETSKLLVTHPIIYPSKLYISIIYLSYYIAIKWLVIAELPGNWSRWPRAVVWRTVPGSENGGLMVG